MRQRHVRSRRQPWWVAHTSRWGECGRGWDAAPPSNGRKCVWVKAKTAGHFERKALTDRQTSTFGTKFGPQKANTKNHQINWVFSLDMFESFPSQVLLSSSTFPDFSWFSPNYCSKSTSLLGDLIFLVHVYRSLCRSPFLLVQSPYVLFFSYLNPHLDWFVIEKQHKSLFLLMNFP